MAVFGNVTFLASDNRLQGFVVAELVVSQKIILVPVLLVADDFWECIGFEFLVLRGVGIIEGPLLERDVFADKLD